MANIKKNKKGQTLSADILVVIVIILFGALFLVLNQINKENENTVDKISKEATVESKVIYDSLKKDNIIDENSNVNVDKLLALSHDEIKQQLNIKNDFAIVFEKEGNLVKVDSEKNINCIGSDKIIVNGVACK